MCEKLSDIVPVPESVDCPETIPPKVYSLPEALEELRSVGGTPLENTYLVLADSATALGEIPVRIPVRSDILTTLKCWRIESEEQNKGYAYTELKRAGYMDDGEDDINYWMANSVLQMINLFSHEGHSGMSAPFAINLFSRLAHHQPLGPLTGEDDEWNDISEYGGSPSFQNKRCSSVFKDAAGEEAYNIDGYVFIEPYTNEETGEVSSCSFTSSASRKKVTFPYNVPDKPIYLNVEADHEPEDLLAAVAAYELSRGE